MNNTKIEKCKILYRSGVIILLLLFGIISCDEVQQSSQNSSDSTLTISGTYRGENVTILQPGFSKKIVRVNGKEINDTAFKYSIYEIKLKSYNFKDGEKVKIEIVYSSKDEAPEIMNPEALNDPPLLNKKLPLLIGKDINGNDINTETMVGKVLVINTWFVECKPCVAEMPALNKLVKKFENKNVVFIAPALSGEEKIKKLLLDNPFNYSIIPNSDVYCDSMLKCVSYPNNIIVNKKGVIIYFVAGAFEDIETILNAEIEKALKE